MTTRTSILASALATAVVAVAGAGAWGCGHPPILRDLSAGHTECTKEEVVLFDHRAHQGTDVWRVECKGRFYDCRAEGFDTVDATCTEIPDAEVTPAMRESAEQERAQVRRR